MNTPYYSVPDGPVPPMAPPPMPVKPPVTVWGVCRCILSVLVLLILIPSLIGAVGLFAAQRTLDVAVDTAVDALLQGELLTDSSPLLPTGRIPLPHMANVGATTEETTDRVPDASALAASLYETYAALYTDAGLEVPMTEDQLAAVLERSTVGEFLSKKVREGVDALLEGGELLITTEEIMGLLKENEALIIEVSGYEIPPESYAQIEAAIEESGITSIPLTEAVSMPEELEELQVIAPVFSTLALTMVAAFCLLQFGLLVILNIKSRYLAFLYSGLALVIGGTLCALALAGSLVAAPMLEGLSNAAFLAGILRDLLASIWVPGLCFVAVGVGLLVAFGLLRARWNKRAAAAYMPASQPPVAPLFPG